MRWPERTDRERFFEKIEQPANGAACWVWTAGRTSGGYGSFFYGGCVQQTNRVAWQLFRGEIPGELHVLHTCDNRKCCNPAHLFLGTNDDNVADKMQKGRHTWANKTHCTRGHSLSGDNLAIARKSGARCCRACLRMHGRVYDRKRRPPKRLAVAA